MTLAYAMSRLSGVSTPANAAYSASELEFQLKNSKSTALFTVCSQQLEVHSHSSLICRLSHSLKRHCRPQKALVFRKKESIFWRCPQNTRATSQCRSEPLVN